MATNKRTELEALTERLSAAELAISELRAEVAQLRGTPEAAPGAAPAPALEPQGAASAAKHSEGFADVLQLLHNGEVEEAQLRLLALPREELAADPAAVALVTATICVQRGDIESGLVALREARRLTSEPRVLYVIELMEREIADKPAA